MAMAVGLWSSASTVGVPLQPLLGHVARRPNGGDEGLSACDTQATSVSFATRVPGFCVLSAMTVGAPSQPSTLQRSTLPEPAMPRAVQ